MSQLVDVALSNVAVKIMFLLNLDGQVSDSIFTEKVCYGCDDLLFICRRCYLYMQGSCDGV